ncbi:phosphopantetheine-binding protein [Paraconexibacter antarcticus]|jgi:acyl carrier protein|uniref:Phosphopantetheine-binding protein n=1 Tax=Paraconexibacter antarcticus TaxID=2949664 RepID=A0ABY5DPI5_9ACTN|nr:phosphopantetheine-binding protein [Paraconexibacter antarcticus]UTI63529.1 phosphopantetheine-binding protein [Paraconexibacter antarcticus]
MSTITNEAVEKTVIEALISFGAEPDEVTPETELTTLDIDSLDLAELSQIVDDEYGVTMKSSDVSKIKTVGDIVAVIVAKA